MDFTFGIYLDPATFQPIMNGLLGGVIVLGAVSIAKAIKGVK
jgi:hypothetical protein